MTAFETSQTLRAPARTGSPAQAPTRFDHLCARLLAWRIERELKSDGVTWRSPVHAARALQLTSDRCRWGLAKSLEATLARVDQPRPGAFTAAIPPDRTAVAATRPMMLQTAARLRAAAPVSVIGIIALRDLLADGNGPLYVGGNPQVLADRLNRILASLDAWH